MSKVTEYLTRRGVEFRAIEHRPAFTAVSEARALDVPPAQVAKTVVLDTREGHVVAVVPATRTVSVRLVRDALGDPHARVAPEDEIERDYPEFEPGAIPPIGALTGTPTIVDPEVAEAGSIMFASGIRTESVRMSAADLLADPNVRVAPIARHVVPLDDRTG